MRVRVRLLVCICLCAFAVGPGNVGAARAVNIPAPDVCVGIPHLVINPVTNEWYNFGALWCGLHDFYIDGTSTAPLADLCPGGGAAILHFTGTIRMDLRSPVPATWTIVGVSGVFAMTLQSGPLRFAGTGVYVPLALTLPCDPHSIDIAMVAAHSPFGVTPNVMVCRATGTVGPITLNYRFPALTEGPASGAGTCLSDTGAWDVAYTGSWGGAVTQPCAGSFDVYVTATNRSSGHSFTQEQLWISEASYKQFNPIVVQNGSIRFGGGLVTESPDPCTVPPSMHTSATWAFVAQD